jgi:hypothetical protein
LPQGFGAPTRISPARCSHDAPGLRRDRRQLYRWRDLIARRREQLRAYAAPAQPALFELSDDSPAVVAYRRRALQRADAVRPMSRSESMKGRRVSRHAGPITLTVIGVPACTVRQS